MVHQWLTNDHVPRNESYVAFQLTTAHRDQSTHYGIYYRASNFFIDEKDGERYHYPDVAQWKYSKMKIKKNPRLGYADDYSGRESRMSAADWAEAMSELQRSRPRPLAKAFGTNGPNEMQLKNWTAQSKDWNSRYRYASKMQKAALIRDNAEFAARINPRIKKDPEIHIDIGSHNATRSKRVRTNPKQPAARDLDQAKKLFRGFTGKEPQGVTRLKIKPFSTGLAIGKILGIIYEVSATGEKLKHSFKDSARPHLIVSSDGHQVLICGGRFTFTSRGFVDK